jgi:hypothetical protein
MQVVVVHDGERSPKTISEDASYSIVVNNKFTWMAFVVLK